MALVAVQGHIQSMSLSVNVHFVTITTAFTVADIAQPLITSILPEWQVADAIAVITEDAQDFPDNWFGLVRQDNQILGYIASDFISDDPTEGHDGPIEGAAIQYCTPILPDQIVPNTLPLLDLIPLFEKHFFFFVLTGNDLSHTVSFLNLDQLPAKLSLFTLVIGLEAELLHLYSLNPAQISAYLSRLPNNRLQKAKALAQEKLVRRKQSPQTLSPNAILNSTEFIDKATILLRSPELFTALPFPSKTKAESFFNQLQELRNQIAHSNSILETLSTPALFADCLGQLRAVTSVISALANRSE